MHANPIAVRTFEPAAHAAITVRPSAPASILLAIAITLCVIAY